MLLATVWVKKIKKNNHIQEYEILRFEYLKNISAWGLCVWLKKEKKYFGIGI